MHRDAGDCRRACIELPPERAAVVTIRTSQRESGAKSGSETGAESGKEACLRVNEQCGYRVQVMSMCRCGFRYGHIRATIDTGASMSKYLDKHADCEYKHARCCRAVLFD